MRKLQPRSLGLRQRKPMDDQSGIHLTGDGEIGILLEIVSMIFPV